MKRLAFVFFLALGLTFLLKPVSHNQTNKPYKLSKAVKSNVQVLSPTKTIINPIAPKSNPEISNREINICSPIDIFRCDCSKADDFQFCYDQQIEVINQVYSMTFSNPEEILSFNKYEKFEFEFESINAFVLDHLRNPDFSNNWVKFQEENNSVFSCPTEENNCSRDDVILSELEQAQIETLANRAEDDYQFQKEMEYNHRNN